MNNPGDDGATKLPEPENKLMECPGDGSGQRFAHAWKWVWANGVMTDRVQCSTCGVQTKRGINQDGHI